MKDTNNKLILKNTFFMYIRMAFVMLITFYSSRIILRTLGEEDYGIFNVVGGVIAMMSFLNTSMTSGFQRFLNVSLGKGNIDEYRKVFSVSLAIQIIIGILIILLSETIGLWFVNTQLIIPENRYFAANIVFQCSIIITIINLFISPVSAVIISYEKMGLYAVVSILQSVFKLLIIFLAGLSSYDKLIFYALLLVVVDVIVLCCYLIATKQIPIKLTFKPSFDKGYLKNMLGFSGWNLFGSSAHMLQGNGLNVLMNMFFGPTVNAARAISGQVSFGLRTFYTNFQIASRPQVMKYYAVGDNESMLKLTYQMSKVSFVLMWVVSLPVIFNTDWILTLWLGDKYPSYTAVFIQLELCTAVIESLATPLSTIVHATGKMRNFQVICSLVIMMIIPISYVFLKLGYGPVSALLVVLFMIVVVHAVRLVIIKQIIKFSIKTYLKDVIVPCVLLSIMSLLAVLFLIKYTFLNDYSLLSIILIFLLSVIFSMIFTLNKNERHFVLKKLKLIK